MANDLSNKTNGGTLAAPAAANPFLQYADAARHTNIEGQLLKFSKGDWTAGQDNNPIDDGTEFVANMDKLRVGWVRWEDNKPTDYVMGLVVEGWQPPLRSTLGDTDEELWGVDLEGKPRDPWQFTNNLVLMGEGEEIFTFATSSKGGVNAVAALSKVYGPRWLTGKFPVVAIGQGSYQHPIKELGRIKVPQFNVVGWVDKDRFVETPDGLAAQAEPEEAPPAKAAPRTPTAQQKARAKVTGRF